MIIKKAVFCLALFMPVFAFAQTHQQATKLSRAKGVGENKQGYLDNIDWVENAKNGIIVNYALSVDDNILESLKQLESRGNWHAIQSQYDIKTRKWLTEGKSIEELIKQISTLTDIIGRRGKPGKNIIWNSDSTVIIDDVLRSRYIIWTCKDTVVINGVKYTKNLLGPYRAAGAYQFMPETAIAYGLEIDHLRGIDERFDEEKAKEAARLYLNELLERYDGNLDLAIAAYNTGERNIDAFLEGNKKLARETVDYVPGFFSRMEDHVQYRKDTLDLEQIEQISAMQAQEYFLAEGN